jgi:hypothetical protein
MKSSAQNSFVLNLPTDNNKLVTTHRHSDNFIAPFAFLCFSIFKRVDVTLADATKRAGNVASGVFLTTFSDANISKMLYTEPNFQIGRKSTLVSDRQWLACLTPT